MFDENLIRQAKEFAAKDFHPTKLKPVPDISFFQRRLGITYLQAKELRNFLCFPQMKITNMDRIRSMNDEKLAEMLVPKVMFCDDCPLDCPDSEIPESGHPEICIQRVIAWLNSPAETEDGK